MGEAVWETDSVSLLMARTTQPRSNPTHHSACGRQSVQCHEHASPPNATWLPGELGQEQGQPAHPVSAGEVSRKGHITDILAIGLSLASNLKPLCTPTISFLDLQYGASGGLIIVFASEYSCDMLIVFLNRDPIHIPLQITEENVRDLPTKLHTLIVCTKRLDMMRELTSLLSKPWDQIILPIVDCLQTTIHLNHASGTYRKGE